MKKNERLKLFDISLTILNVIALIIIAISVFVNIFLTILSFFSTAVLFGLTLVIFSRKNPYYIISSSGMAICGFVFSIGLLAMPEWSFHPFFSIFLLVTIPLDVYFIAGLIKVSESSWSGMSGWVSIGMVIEPDTNAPMYTKDRYEPLKDDRINKTAKNELEKAFRKKNHARWILLITFISTFMFFSTTIFSLL